MLSQKQISHARDKTDEDKLLTLTVIIEEMNGNENTR